MRNKLDAVNYFCSAAETLNFRETAQRFAVSPSVITRMINELETELGEPLFKRNTRNIRLTHFGEQFLPLAVRWLKDGDSLFQSAKRQEKMAGMVRITVPSWQGSNQILASLLTALAPYPELIIDWRADMAKLDRVADRIDIGLRFGLEPEPDFIVRRIADITDMLVISPKLLAELGQPSDLNDLADRYPFVGQINANTGKMWHFPLNETLSLQPHHIRFLSDDVYSGLQAVIAGKGVGLISDIFCRPHLQSGELVQLFPELDVQQWRLFLYRPYSTQTPQRVLKVFELLFEILTAHFANGQPV